MAMDLKPSLDLIRDTLKTGLPPLLAAEGLADFDSYLSIPNNNSEELQLTVNPSRNTNSTGDLVRPFIIIAQLYRISDNASYFDVIEPFIRENITPELLGLTNRVSIDSDFYPIDLNRSTSYVIFDIVFSSGLDDCED